MLSEEQTAAGSTTQKSRQTVLWDGDGGLCQRAWVEIDLAALTHNVKQLKHLLSPNTELMAVVKADAYGHGAIAVSQTALQAGASWLGVATIPEGIELREAGIEAPILLLGATNTPAQVKAIAQWHLQPTICTAKQALIFSEVLVSLNQSLPVHAKLDTGMSRLGTSWQDATEFVQLVNGLPNLKLASIYSHLATADSPDRAVMREQQQRFKKAIAQIQAAGINPCRLHLANSAAALTDPDLHYDLVRAGLATYGLYPAPHLQAIASLQPAMQVKARVTQVKTIAAGTGVSYGYKFIAGRETQIAVVGIGYADGIPRNLSTKMQVLVRGKFVPQVGAVTMDQLMLDVTDIPDLEVGEVVTLLGNDGENKITADDWAEILGTISWEILCGFKHRLPRVTVNC
ncbi:MAG: alanine racemase [Microcoleus sp. PH2017_29_MFU_D_A]|jgi:alanine racemase|uniref:alanine racemase n=1 Tax=unclassified Microcoleus TaxID=2642155 RepID=UPI001D42F7B7|nr:MULTISPECIES: alanine racemase [unclassified Microcoleus]MCC3419124.1 alanine racemase [Microcoleus sp. PH2017_07_MST_O_A]MCC3431539.1 alanine racemase [Microcoleus sp. PH2017_04_SCI_O_A]MCC3507866.1 alanine racemase [Microcoleus sp. PH2017_17_BER_D_A]TAE05696.1 MAG: alanine racemase [Oscillatoriales cyanobacterium]MCC3423692.1 alanine racemase [Microcoleus sp. PH2017_01_SCD_O_A]